MPSLFPRHTCHPSLTTDYTDKFDHGSRRPKRNRKRVALVNKVLSGNERSRRVDLRWLLHAKSSIGCKSIRSRQRYSHNVGFSVDGDPFKRASVERQPQTKRRDVNAFAERIERLNVHPLPHNTNIPAERLPAELRMIDNVSSDIERVTKEVWSIVATVRVPFMRRWKRMECSGSKSFLVDVRQRAHRAAVTNAQEILIVRMFSIVRQNGNRIETRPVVMQLPLDPSDLAAVEKVPVTTRVAVVTPVRQRRHVANDRIERNERFVVMTEILAPRINFFLAR